MTSLPSASELPYTWWRIQAWTTAPGDFPQQALSDGWFHATTINHAIDKATEYWLRSHGDVAVVSARRHPLRPPWLKETA